MNDKLFSDVSAVYNSTGSIKATAREFKISEQKTRKILITQGIIPGDPENYHKIKVLVDAGLSPKEISEKLKLSENYINSFLPYEKGVYNSEIATKNASAIRLCRQKKKEMRD